MNPLQVTNLCSTRRGTLRSLWSRRRRRKGDTNRSWRSSTATATSALRLWLRDCGFSGSSLRSCCTFHRRQSAGLLLQQMPVAQMPDIKGKSSASCDSTRFDLLRYAAAAAQWNWSISRSTLASRCINKISYIYISTYISYAQSGEKLKVIVTFWAWQRRKRVCLYVWG